MNLNKVSLIGRVTKDPEPRALPGGGSVVSFGIATNRTWKDKEGAKKEEVEFHNIVAFGKLAEIIGQYVKKGQLIYLDGRLQTRSWDDKESGKKNYKTEIVAENMQMGPKSANAGAPREDHATADDAADLPPAGASEEVNIDDIPF